MKLNSCFFSCVLSRHKHIPGYINTVEYIPKCTFSLNTKTMPPKILCCFLLIFLYSCVSGRNLTGIDKFIYAKVPENGLLNFTELTRKCGFECEEHTVTTEDGYILTLFHIKGNGPPLFLMHGVASSADDYVRRLNSSIAITMAREGYDVWAGNTRGNQYTRRHISLDPERDEKEFWDFTLQELAVFDLAAMLDYVLKKTGQTQLQAIGHSQGNTLFLILSSEKPEYNKKVKLLISLAPICYLHNTRSLVKAGIVVFPVIYTTLKLLGRHELLPKQVRDLITFVCSQKTTGYEICAKRILFPAAGSDPDQLEPEFFREVVGSYPSSPSVKNINHFVQIAQRKKFSKYNYGLLQNLKKYGTVVPPDYDLKQVTMEIDLVAAENDNISTLEDVEILIGQLPNVRNYHVMERKQWNHINYVLGRDVDDYLELLKKYLRQ